MPRLNFGQSLMIALGLTAGAGGLESALAQEQPNPQVMVADASQPRKATKGKQSVDQLVSDGNWFYDHNDWKPAIKHFNKAILIDDVSPDIYAKISFAYGEDSNHSAALEAMRISVKHAREENNPLIGTLKRPLQNKEAADLYKQAKQETDAQKKLALLQKVNGVEKDNPEILYHIANTFSTLGNQAETTAWLYRSRKADPTFLPALIALSARTESQDPKRAKHMYGLVNLVDPQN